MNYYTTKGKKIKCDQTKLLGTGTRGKVYLTPDKECIKVWTNTEEAPFENNIFDELKSLSLPNYYILESLLFKNKKDIFLNNAIGYLYQYTESTDIDILTTPKSYTLDNLNELLKANKILTQNNIMANDARYIKNVILNNNSIIAIDVDLYTKVHYLSSRELERSNITELEELFKELYIDSIIKYHQELNNLKTKSLLYGRNLFALNYREGVSELSKKLSKYKYPIDYLKQK